MIRARVYIQAPPTVCGTMIVEGEQVPTYSANLLDRGIVEGVTSAEVWLRAKAITPAPVMEWLK